MRINVAVPEAHVTRPVLDAALEATTRLNEAMIKAGDVPLFDEVRDHIRWKPEPPGQEHFDHAGIVIGRKWGDCDDMAPYAAASMRASGEDPGATAIVKRSGPQRWHAVVQRSDGTIRDPSRETGMGQTNGVLGSALPLMRAFGGGTVNGIYRPRPQLALRPVRSTRTGEVEAWQARADLPWDWTHGQSPEEFAMSSLHASPGSSEAIVGACEGLLRLGEANDVDPELLTRAAAIRDACEGCPWEELAGMYGEEDATAAGALVGSFFSNLAKKAAPLLSNTPFAPLVATFGGKDVAQRMAPGNFGGGGFGPGGVRPTSSAMPILQMKEFLAQNPQFAPIAKTVLPMAGMAFGPLGAMGGNMLAQFVTPQQAAFASASPELQASLQQGMNLPPPGYGGGGGGMFGGGGGFDPMALMSMFGGAMPFG